VKNAPLSADKDIVAHTIDYPSGAILEITGCMAGAFHPQLGFQPCISRIGPKQEIAILDPRAVITRKEGVVWGCRWHPGGLPTWAQDWLQEHPEWPPIDLRTPSPEAEPDPTNGGSK
jgi:hypothetical protein